LVIHGLVYDVTSLLSPHPGGAEVLLAVAGQEDASQEFDEAFHPDYVKEDMQEYLVGRLGDKEE